ncbi:GtrA family protein [Paenibacillus sp. FSL K6-2524]|uniref:GtrA family protein n=1 Tax=Paenibacillus sp. FSL K6-2524 TaxID=2954516 RepID=UPI0030F6A559
MKNQSIKFIIVGVLNTVVGFLVYAAFIHFIHNNYLQALITSHIIGVAHSYLWNNRWTFQQKKYNARSAVKFMSVYVVTFFVNLFLLAILVDTIEMNKLVAQAIALFLTTLVSFFGHKYWSFRTSKKSLGVK